MLTILLKILSILGILLLIILGLLLLIILLILFVPVFYKIHVVKDSDWNIAVRAHWLLGLLRAQFLYPEPGTATVRVLFFKIFDSGAESSKTKDSRPEKKKRKKSGEKKDKKAAKEDPIKSSAEKNKQADKKTTNAAQTSTQTRSEATDKGKTSKQAQNTAESFDETNSWEAVKQNPIEKIQYTFRNICDKIKNVRENVEHYKEILLCEDTKGLLNHAFMRLGKILKSIRPRKLKADIRFGTGAPDTTGYAYAIYGVLCPYLGRHVLLVPDFEQAVLEGNLYAAGHITVFKLLWHGLWIVLDKRLRKLISKLKQED